MHFNEIAETSRAVASTRSRLRKTEALAACLARLAPAEIEIAAAFLAGEIRQGKIGVGYATIRGVVSEAPPAESPTLTLHAVDEALSRIRDTSGAGSTRRKTEILAELLRTATEPEQSLLVRLLLGEIRQGALDGVLTEAIAQAADAPSPVVRRAVMLAGDIPSVAVAALTEGEAGLERFRLELFRPVQPMLAQTANDVEGALDRLGRAAFELKLDGARIQVHKRGNEIRVYTRKLNEVTVAVPEVVELGQQLPSDELILGGEVIALRPDGSPHPFQTTMRRFGRKLDVERVRSELPLSPFFFDCLKQDDTELIDRGTDERGEALGRVLPASALVPRVIADDAEEAGRFFEDALGRGHEGVMAKDLTAPYEAGGRGYAWLKIKPAHTLDLVVLAVEEGSGRRRGWLSNLHLGARDPATGGFVMLGKTFKGLTDEVLAWQTDALGALETQREGHVVHVRPELVVEIAFNDIQASPHYPGGMALRFARVRGYRADKSAAEADTVDTVRAIFEGRA